MPDVSKDSRYINAVSDVRSELVIPLLLKDRCIGVFDLESPELDAFSKKHVELLTLLASQAAVAIENARLYEAIRDNEMRLEKEVRFAQRVQMALLPQELPKKLKGVDVAWHFDPARELGGDIYEFLSPDPNTLVVAVGDVSGKGVPAALYSSFVGEVVRGRTYRRRFMPERGSPARRADVAQPHPARARARGVLLHAVLRGVRSEEAHRDASQLRAAVSRSRVGRHGRADRSARRAARIVRRRRPTTRSRVDLQARRCLRRSARTASPRPSTPRARSSAQRGSSRPSREQPRQAGQGNRRARSSARCRRSAAKRRQTDDQTVVVVKITN